MQVTRTSDGRAALLRAFERSGLSMAEFCRRQNLPYSTLASWRSMARRAASRFIEVETDEPAVERSHRRPGGGDLCAELVLPGGAVLRIYRTTMEGGDS